MHAVWSFPAGEGCALGKHNNYQFKKRLTAYLMAMALTMALVCVSFFYGSSRQSLLEYMANTQLLNVKKQMNTIDYQLQQMDSFIIWLLTNANLRSLLARDEAGAKIFDTTKRDSYAEINRQFNFTPITRYIGYFLIQANNGLIFRNGHDAYSIDPEAFETELWYQAARQSNGKTILSSAVKNYTNIPAQTDTPNLDYVIPVFKYLNNRQSLQREGHLIMLFSTDMLFSLDDMEMKESGSSSLLCDNEGMVIFSSIPGEIGTKLTDPAMLQTAVKGEAGSLISKENHENIMVVYARSASSQYHLIHKVPLSNILQNSGSMVHTILAALSLGLLFSLLLSLYLSSGFSKPVQYLVAKVNRIAKGNFETKEDHQTLFCVELATLNHSIDRMNDSITTLLKESILREAEKRKMEMQMLQLQINPHFLYNTLNSIKWMATLQGLDGIRTMVSSLGALLHAAFDKYAELIPLRQEMDILQYYLNIQQIKYKGSITFHVACEEKALLDSFIPKFTLQPLVENAIFHGIEPKHTMQGVVEIRIWKNEDTLCVSVYDDGVGIPQERMGQLIKMQNTQKGRNIGIANVHRRLQLFFGDAFGLEVQSELGQYTHVTVRIPYTYTGLEGGIP